MLNRRRQKERLARLLMALSLALVVGAFLLMAGVVLWRGLPHLNLSMLVNTPGADYYQGGGGGIANALVGTLWLGLGASTLALTLSLPAAVAMQRAYASRRLAAFTRLMLDVLWGTPSIVFGAFAFVIMMALGLRASLLAGILTLTLVMLPVMIRAMAEALEAVPRELQIQALALGATRTEAMVRIVLRQARPALATGFLLAFGRGLGDAASIMFTAGYSDHLPSSILDPVASLPLSVFYQLATPDPQVQARAYASALVLLILVLAVAFTARLLTRRLSCHTLR